MPKRERKFPDEPQEARPDGGKADFSLPEPVGMEPAGPEPDAGEGPSRTPEADPQPMRVIEAEDDGRPHPDVPAGPGYHVGDWCGRPNFCCDFCTYATLGRALVVQHILEFHAPQLRETRSRILGPDGNPIMRIEPA